VGIPARRFTAIHTFQWEIGDHLSETVHHIPDYQHHGQVRHEEWSWSDGAEDGARANEQPCANCATEGKEPESSISWVKEYTYLDTNSLDVSTLQPSFKLVTIREIDLVNTSHGIGLSHAQLLSIVVATLGLVHVA
jgi:hypothetical protein